MKTVIAYASRHHGNTKMLTDAIAECCGVDVIDVASCERVDLSEYNCIGFASGIAYGKYYPQLLEFMEKNLPNEKRVFFLHTAGDPREAHNSAAKAIAEKKNCECLGTYFCKGYDTYGPFRLFGGIAKGHPNHEDIAGAVAFFEKIAAQ